MNYILAAGESINSFFKKFVYLILDLFETTVGSMRLTDLNHYRLSNNFMTFKFVEFFQRS